MSNKTRNPVLAIALIGASLFSLPALAAEQRDPAAEFEAFNQELESDFTELDATLEANFQALDEALEAGYQQLQREVSAAWGEGEVELPTKKKWVDYSADINTRRLIDFENGEVVIEHLVDGDESDTTILAALNGAADAVTSDTIGDLSEKDLSLKYAKAQLAQENITFDPYAAADDGAVVGSLVKNIAKDGELSNVVGKAMSSGEADQGGVKARVSQTSNGKKKVTVQVPFNFGYQTTLASRYRNTVIREARAHNVSPSLLYAVMETESSFNPRARSGVPAFGLMQLVPRSGAMDAYNYVYGEKIMLDPEYLYDPARNVELGAAYLSLVYTRYLRHIKNPESRLYCTIAAYNTGAGNVAKTFVGTTSVKQAAEVIDRMSSAEVYEYLVKNLPYEETQRYLQKVTKAQEKFRAMDTIAGVPIDAG